MRLIELPGGDPPDSLEEQGPLARLDIAHGPQAQGQSFQLHHGDYTALIDTGARMSCIDSDLAERLNLPIIGPPIDGVAASGPFKSDPVLGLIHLPDLETMAYGRFLTLPVTEHDQPYHALIGRDFLRRAKFTYDGIAGDWSIEFEPPTITIASRQHPTDPKS